MIKLIASFLLLFTVSESRSFAYEVTTPYGNSVNAWAVCEPGNAPGGLYVWTRNDILIPSVSSNWYFLQDADDGQLLRCGDSLDNLSPALQIGSAPTPSAPAPLPTPAPVPAPPPTQPPIDSTSGIVIRSPWGHSVGSWLICEVDSSRHVPQTFIWLRDESIIAGSTNIGHLITTDDEDTSLTCSTTTTLNGDVVFDPLFIGTIFEPPMSTLPPRLWSHQRLPHLLPLSPQLLNLHRLPQLQSLSLRIMASLISWTLVPILLVIHRTRYFPMRQSANELISWLPTPMGEFSASMMSVFLLST